MIDVVSSSGFSTTGTPAANKDALQRAIANAAGEVVFISEGNYDINPLAIATPHTHLQLSPGAILHVPSDTQRNPSILNIVASNVTVEGGQFEGNSVAGVGGMLAIRIYGSHSHVTIRGCHIRNASTGIGAYNGANCEDWLIEDNIIDTTVHGHGILLHGHPQENRAISGVVVRNNVIHNAKQNGIWVGIHYTDVEISGNRIYDSERMGIEVWQNPMGRFVIAHNRIYRCASFGISIADTSETVCEGNIITNSTSYGIEVAGSRFVTLANNHIAHVKPRESGGGKPTGIALNSREDYTLGDICISGGTIVGCVSAINLCGDKGKRNNINVSNVVIRDCLYGIRNVGNIGQKDGGSTIADLVINGCSIHCKSTGIGNSFYGGVIQGAIISGNNIYSSEGNGIDMFRPSEVSIVGNRICGNNVGGSAGIRLREHSGGTARSHDLMVADNLIVRFPFEQVFDPMLKPHIVGDV